MPIISPLPKQDKKVIRGRIPAELEEQLCSYMSWVGVKKMDDFLEQAIEFVLKSDRDWRKVRKEKEKQNSKV